MKSISPFLHAFLQRRQQELLVEAVDGADVGEDAHDHLTGEGAASSGLLHQLGSRTPGPGGVVWTRKLSPYAAAH